MNVDQLMRDRHVIERHVLVDVPDIELGSVAMHNVFRRLSRTPGSIRFQLPGWVSTRTASDSKQSPGDSSVPTFSHQGFVS